MPDQPWVPRPVNDLSDSLEGRVSAWQLEATVSPELGQHLANWLWNVLVNNAAIRERLHRVRRLAPGALTLDRETMLIELGGPRGVLAVVHDTLQIMESRARAQHSSPDIAARSEERQTVDHVRALKELLDDFGSAFDLTIGPMGISWRVPPEIMEAVASAVAGVEGDYPRAAQRLRAAWKAAYGLDPQPSAAILDCIRAVEAVAIPVVIPNQDGAQYWHVLGHLTSQGEAWRLVIMGQHGNDSVEPVVSMMERLGGAHLDRHEGREPPEPSVGAAQAAVMLAVTLVHWFNTGAVSPR